MANETERSAQFAQCIYGTCAYAPLRSRTDGAGGFMAARFLFALCLSSVTPLAASAEELGGLRLHAPVPEQPWSFSVVDDHPLADLDASIQTIAGPDGRITHVFALSYDQLEQSWTQMEAYVSSRMGPSDGSETDPFGQTALLWHDPDDEFRFRLAYEEGCCGTIVVALTLETTAPDRLCGPTDGFDAALLSWQQSIRSGARDDVLAGFAVPFDSQGSLVSLETAAELQAAWSDAKFQEFLASIAEMDVSDFTCDTMPLDGRLEGYHAYLTTPPEVRFYPLLFEREGAAWRASALAFQP